MSVPVTCKVEIATGGTGFFDTSFFDPSFFDLGTLWRDIIAESDVRTAANIVVEYGIRGNSPGDRVASTGTATFALDNSQANSAGLLGYYSLLNSNKRSGFDLNIPVRVSFGSSQLSYFLMTQADNPLGYWRLNELAGTVADDQASGNHDGTYSGGFTLGVTGAVGDGTAVTFNGADGNVSMGNVAAFAFTTVFTVEAWFKTSASLSLQGIAGKGAGYQLYINATGKVGFESRTAASAVIFSLITSASYNDGVFHYVVATWDGTTATNGVKIYIDGVNVVSGTAVAGTPAVTADAFQISPDFSPFSGTLDEVAIYNYALSSSRVVAKFLSPTTVSYFYKFYGSMDSAIPIPGQKLERLTHCTAVDIWDDYARIDEPDIDLQTSKRADETLTTLLDALNIQPLSRTIETGSERYVYSIDGGTGQKLKVRERIIQLTNSEFGYCYTQGDTVGGGRFTFENRHHRVIDPTVQFTLNNTMDGLVVPGSRRDVYRTVQVFVHPTNDVAGASTIVIWSLQNTTTVIAANETNTTIFGAYFDPTTHEEIGGTSTIDPIATTDYTFNTAQDGSGTDLTANFTVTASRTGLGVRWTIVNTSSTQSAYITKLQVRGKPIYRFDAVLEVTVAGSYGDQVLEIDMPFQNNTNVGMDVANFTANRYSRPFAQVEWVRFLANRDSSHMNAALTLEPGDRVALTETVSGLSATEFIINGCRYEFTPQRQLWCTWYLEAAGSAHYWLLGTVGFGELGQKTTLGF